MRDTPRRTVERLSLDLQSVTETGSALSLSTRCKAFGGVLDSSEGSLFAADCTRSHELDDYLLPRNATESERLNLQHKIFESSLGYLIHPFILQHVETPNTVVAIADIGCGTGVWLREAAKVFPVLLDSGLTLSVLAATI